MMVTIRQKWDGLQAFLLPGVYNLTSEEIVIAIKACDQLIKAIPEVSLDEELEDYRRTFLNQVKIIRRELSLINTPSFTTEAYFPTGSNLYQIALDMLGDAERWSEIFALNDLEEPYLDDMTKLLLPVK